MTHDRRWLLATTITIAAAINLTSAGAVAQQDVPRFEKVARCPFTPGQWADAIQLECGNLVVYRVRERPAEGTLKLAVGIVRPLQGSTGIPLVLPHGGPSGPGGLRGGEMGAAARLAPDLKRDVIVYDERGAGLSEPPLCPLAKAETPIARNLPTHAERQKIWNDGARACATELRATHFDTGMFSTPTNAADLIDLRKALGYASWDIWGVSYGSRIAQEVMRRDPDGVRSVVLVAPVLPGPAQQAEVPLAFQRVLDHLFSACAAQPSCATAFPALAKDFDALFDDLNAHPLDVVFDTPSGSSTVRLDGERMISALHSRFTQRVSRVPMMINELIRGDRFAAARSLLGYASVAQGDNTLSNLVGCFESGGPKIVEDMLADVRTRTRPPFRGLINTLEECPFWQEQYASPGERAFVDSVIPTLILTSEFDDRTPSDYGHRIAAHLARVYEVEMPGLAHGQPDPCERTIARNFLSDPTRAPDTSCISAMTPLVFELKNLEPTSIVLKIDGAIGASSAFAGTWEGTYPDAPVIYRMEFTIDGSDVRGVINGGVQAFPILEGRVDSQTMTFKTKSGDGDRTITFTGKLDGGRIEFTRTVVVRPAGNPGGAALWGASGPKTFTLMRLTR
jgi:pimeloyl-ACP methyl ester carboxylesterase